MVTAHTNGPWRVEGCRIMAAGEQDLALIDGSGGDDSYVTLTEADYRLIAAAPELLAAAKHAIVVDAEWRREHGEPPRTPACQESYDMVLAAIAQAEDAQ